MRRIVALISAPILGFLALAGRVVASTGELLPLHITLVRAAEAVGPLELLFLFLVGAILAIIAKPASWRLGTFKNAGPWILGVAASISFPILSFVDAIVQRGGHNLLGIEWAFYAAYGTLVAWGAWAAQGVYRRLTTRPKYETAAFYDASAVKPSDRS